MRREIVWPEETKITVSILLVHRPDLYEFFKKRAQRYSTSIKDLIGLWIVQERRCALCGEELPMDSTTHIDHIIPKKHGGENNIDNYQLVCAKCNYAKRDLMTKDFIILCLKVSMNHRRKFVSQEELSELLQNKWRREARKQVAEYNKTDNIAKLNYLIGKQLKTGKTKNRNKKYYKNLLESSGLIPQD